MSMDKTLVKALKIILHGGEGFHSACSKCGGHNKVSLWANEYMEITHAELVAVIKKYGTVNEALKNSP